MTSYYFKFFYNRNRALLKCHQAKSRYFYTKFKGFPQKSEGFLYDQDTFPHSYIFLLL